MKYYAEDKGYEEDGLQIEGLPFEVWNVKSGGASRGDLLCSEKLSGEFKLVSGAGDASKQMVIAAGSGSGIIQAYATGVFNASKMNFGGGSAIDFAAALREQNILIRGE